jgi:apolipoprotein N-acyltransferase
MVLVWPNRFNEVNQRTMNSAKPPEAPLTWLKSLFYLVMAVASFHVAYASIKIPAAGLMIFGYAYALVRLADQSNARRAFYFGLTTGFLCYAPELFFFWKIFSALAIALWFIVAFWIGLFMAIVCAAARRWGKDRVVWLMPVVWTGLEYFRSELYYLKFSWVNIGYALPQFFSGPGAWRIGMYAVGFAVFALMAALAYRPAIKRITLLEWLLIVPTLGLILVTMFPVNLRADHHTAVRIAGIQMEFPPEHILPRALDRALARNTNAQVFVLSEYTLDGGVPDALKKWCRDNSRYLIVGGRDFTTNEVFFNTAFVVGTNGEVVFQQAKCKPIQFFKDGLPAPEQKVWDSPWGKIGICICYDLSFTRVTDELVRQGAQMLIVPTMDVSEWGRHQHELHSRVAPVRAAEYGIPIFRLASSGISQAVAWNGDIIAETPMPGNGDILATKINLYSSGTLPLDRYLAPVCTGLTAAIVGCLLLLQWWEHRQKFRNSD